MLDLICPHDKSILQIHARQYHCPSCHRNYPVVDGVICTLEKPDPFYEGAYGNQTDFIPRSEKPWHVWPLWLINSGYVWAVRKSVRAGSTVVELGCAGGVRYFGKRYQMIGCDLSWAALKTLDFYPTRIQSNAASCIPLPDQSVDAVVSSYFWEHIPPNIKPKILQECQRVLKPNGKLVFLYDVETANPLIARYKQKALALYNQLFIDGDGHYGYQWPSENLSLFKEAGFRVLEHRGLEKTWIQGSSVYKKLVQFPNARVMMVSKIDQGPLFYFWTALTRFVDVVICPWLPERWARIDRVVACRESDHVYQ
jgi:SAM-dependent methyltransferase